MYQYIKFIIFRYELFTALCSIAIVIDKIIEIITFVLYIYIVLTIIETILNNIACCPKYSPEENEILKLIKAGDKMDQLNGTGYQYYKSARHKIDSSLPFIDISDDILSKMEEIEIVKNIKIVKISIYK